MTSYWLFYNLHSNFVSFIISFFLSPSIEYVFGPKFYHFSPSVYRIPPPLPAILFSSETLFCFFQFTNPLFFLIKFYLSFLVQTETCRALSSLKYFCFYFSMFVLSHIVSINPSQHGHSNSPSWWQIVYCLLRVRIITDCLLGFRFENEELECLFRRYILRLQHASITAAVALFVVLTAALATTSFVSIQAPTVRNLYDSAHCGIFVVIFIVLCTRVVDDLYLGYVCYGILVFCASFSVLALPGKPFLLRPRSSR